MSKTPEEYNAAELAAGRLTQRHIALAVREFQKSAQLDIDGKAGPATRRALEATIVKTQEAWELEMLSVPRVWPMRCLRNGRKPEITSGFYEENDARPNHRGADLFFRHLADDPKDVKRGDGEGAGRDSDGTVKWWIPPGTKAIASAKGRVVMASWTATGYRAWIDVGPCYDGYFHLETLDVKIGDVLPMGAVIGTVGDNPIDTDADHLHFEMYKGDLNAYRLSKFNSINPRVYLARASYLPAL
jgi:murein DD-endopeptidase MepM/ murein hydrolase activator NlpD